MANAAYILTGKKPSDTYPSLVQFDVTNSVLVNGLGETLATASLTASYAQTASYAYVQITPEYSAFYASESNASMFASASNASAFASWSNASAFASWSNAALYASSSKSSSFADSALFADTSRSASHAIQSDQSISSSFSGTSLFADTSTSASHALRADNADSADSATIAQAFNPNNPLSGSALKLISTATYFDYYPPGDASIWSYCGPFIVLDSTGSDAVTSTTNILFRSQNAAAGGDPSTAVRIAAGRDPVTPDAGTGGKLSIFTTTSGGDTTVERLSIDRAGITRITGSLRVTEGITGSLNGTASYANFATSASYATAAFSSQYCDTASFSWTAADAVSSSWASSSLSSSYAVSATSADSVTSSSHALRADTAGNADTATYANTAGLANSINFVPNDAWTASWVAGANVVGAVASATSASHALRADNADNSTSASHALIASGLNPLVQKVDIFSTSNPSLPALIVQASTSSVGWFLQTSGIHQPDLAASVLSVVRDMSVSDAQSGMMIRIANYETGSSAKIIVASMRDNAGNFIEPFQVDCSGSVTASRFVGTASWAESASLFIAVTSSITESILSSSYVESSSWASASLSSSYADFAMSASYAFTVGMSNLTAAFWNPVQNATQSLYIDGGLIVSMSYSV